MMRALANTRARLAATALSSTLIVVCIATAGPAVATTGPASAAASGRRVLTVNTTADLPNVAPRNGPCRDAAGTCSLRAAVMTADASPRPTTIVLPAGHYTLTRPPRFPLDDPLTDFSAVTGPLVLLRPVTVAGAGARRTVVDGNGITRVFSNLSVATIKDLTVTGGFMPPIPALLPLPIGGGGIANIGVLTLERVALTGNHAEFGAGAFSYPGSFLRILDSVVNGNSGLEAAGIRFDSGGLVVNTTITGNTAVRQAAFPSQKSGWGGGIDARGATPSALVIDNSTIAGNFASKGGGGINVSMGYPPLIPGLPAAQRVSLRNTIVADNSDAAGSADCSHAGIVIFRSLGHNLASDTSCPFGKPSDQRNTNPRLGPLADNGGPTDTLALLTGSPAISRAGSVGCPATDQRGVPRPSGHCDIGAFQTVAR